MRSPILDTKHWVAIVIALIIGVSILGYGYMDYKYKASVLEQKAKSELQLTAAKEAKEAENRRLLQNCLDEMGQRATGIFEGSKTSNLSNEGAKIVLDTLQNLRGECFKKFPQE